MHIYKIYVCKKTQILYTEIKDMCSLYKQLHRCSLQDLIEEIQSVQGEIDRLQTSFTEDLTYDAADSDMADQLAMHSSLAVLAERMATIHMKASGKQQLLEVFIG